MPALHGRRVAGKLDDDVAGATASLGVFIGPAPYQEPRAVLLERGGIGSDVELVSLRVRDVDANDPVALGHGGLLQRGARIVTARRKPDSFRREARQVHL